MSRAREEKKRRGLKNPFRRKPKQQPAAAQAYAPSGPYYDDDGYSERDGYDDDGYDDYASTPRGGAPPASLEELVARITTNSEEQTGLGWPQRLRRFLALFDLPPEPGGDAEDACADIEAVCRFAMMPEALGMSSADLSAILLDIADDLEMPDEGETVALADVLYTILVHPPDWGDWVSDRFVQLAETLQTIGELFEGSLGEALQPHERPAMFASVDSILVLLDALDLQEAEAHLAIKDMLLPLDAHVGASGYGVPPGMSHGISLARLLHWLADFFAAPRAATFHGEAFGSADAAASEEAEAWEVAAVLAGLGPGRDAEARDLFQSLRPDSSDWARVFEQPYASTLARVDARMWQGGQYQLAVPSFGRARPLPLLWSATRAELRRESARLRAREPTRAQLSGLPPQPSAAVSHFPPQWLALAPIVKKGVRVHCFKYAPPAQFFLEDGVVYDGLVKVGGQWRLFLRPWHHVALLPTCAEMEQVRAVPGRGAGRLLAARVGLACLEQEKPTGRGGKFHPTHYRSLRSSLALLPPPPVLTPPSHRALFPPTAHGRVLAGGCRQPDWRRLARPPRATQAASARPLPCRARPRRFWPAEPAQPAPRPLQPRARARARARAGWRGRRLELRLAHAALVRRWLVDARLVRALVCARRRRGRREWCR